MSNYTKMVFALTVLRNYNRLKNDLDAYLYEITEYGLGNRKEFPNKEDYGITSSDS